jgi:hypothetical protein
MSNAAVLVVGGLAALFALGSRSSADAPAVSARAPTPPQPGSTAAILQNTRAPSTPVKTALNQSGVKFAAAAARRKAAQTMSTKPFTPATRPQPVSSDAIDWYD